MNLNLITSINMEDNIITKKYYYENVKNTIKFENETDMGFKIITL